MIKNLTRKTIITNSVSNKSVFGKVKGLIGESTPQAIIFKTRFGIHTFLLKFPIDVLILDQNHKVKKLKSRLNPNQLFFWNIKFDTVIELPENSLEKSKTQIGDIIQFT
jgi:uncharacterized protein